MPEVTPLPPELTRSVSALARSLDAINVDALSPRDYLTVLTMRWDAEARAEEALLLEPR